MKAKAGIAKRRENLSKETLQKMSQAAKNRQGPGTFFGKHHSEKAKRILSKLRMRPVKMFSLDGNFIKEFDSIKNAAEQMNIHKVAISNCCRGMTKTSGGYIWKYSDSCDL